MPAGRGGRLGGGASGSLRKESRSRAAWLDCGRVPERRGASSSQCEVLVQEIGCPSSPKGEHPRKRRFPEAASSTPKKATGSPPPSDSSKKRPWLRFWCQRELELSGTRVSLMACSVREIRSARSQRSGSLAS